MSSDGILTGCFKMTGLVWNKDLNCICECRCWRLPDGRVRWSVGCQRHGPVGNLLEDGEPVWFSPTGFFHFMLLDPHKVSQVMAIYCGLSCLYLSSIQLLRLMPPASQKQIKTLCSDSTGSDRRDGCRESVFSAV